MKNIIIGTAGHIDHGKTTLIKALTGRNTDRWEEEQKRGITIDLGFTYFDLPSGDRAGIIDVPGHERFINNMVAGVVGMDLVLLVIAADEGIMPQTREHMDILHLLGIEKSIIVLNKCDIVDEEWLELVEEEVREELKGTFLDLARSLPEPLCLVRFVKKILWKCIRLAKSARFAAFRCMVRIKKSVMRDNVWQLICLMLRKKKFSEAVCWHRRQV